MNVLRELPGEGLLQAALLTGYMGHRQKMQDEKYDGRLSSCIRDLSQKLPSNRTALSDKHHTLVEDNAGGVSSSYNAELRAFAISDLSNRARSML